MFGSNSLKRIGNGIFALSDGLSKLNQTIHGSINNNDVFEEIIKNAKKARKKFPDKPLWILGGPPCQGYSGIGHRRSYKVDKEKIPSNYLYKEMYKVIEHFNPKAFIFENVRGLLSARWTKNGAKGEIFKDVLKQFSKLKNYNYAKPRY